LGATLESLFDCGEVLALAAAHEPADDGGDRSQSAMRFKFDVQR
jgi:hypothetical protein